MKMDLTKSPQAIVGETAKTPLPGGKSGVCLIFATRGRAAVLKSIVGSIDRQTVKPDRIIISCVTDEDVAGLPDRPDLQVIKGRPGLTAQRNSALCHVPEDTNVVIFLDDDFLMHEDWIAQVLKAFEADPSVACITGTLLADGIHGPGYTIEQAQAILDRAAGIPAHRAVTATGGPYGCNMAFRARKIADLRFDERLVLYGWLEDRDFGGQIWNHGGRVVRINTALGVHLGVKGGRVSGRCFGYSQVINPLYLVRKGTMPLRGALNIILRNLAANTVRSFAPEPHVDRLGRLRGNMIGLRDLVRGRLTPESAKTL